MATLEELLHPSVLMPSIIDRIKPPGDALQRFWGMHMGGPATEPTPLNVANWDIFDSVRDAENFRADSSGAATIAANPVGNVTVKLARVNSKIPLEYKRLRAMRPLGGQNTQIDRGGMNYLTRQETTLKQRHQNAREWLVAAMMRGNGYLVASGENWVPSFSSSGATVSIDWQVPSANKGTVNSIIGTLWSDTTNATVFQDILDINAYAWELHGYGIEHVWCNSLVWGDVTGNADLKSRAGTSNMVYDVFKRNPGATDKDAAKDGFEAVLKPLPWLTWHVYDGGVKLGGTFTKFFPDTGVGSAVFCPTPTPDIAVMLEGSETIAEDEVNAPQERQTPYFWRQYVRDPARVELFGLQSFMCALHVPKVLFPSTIR